MNRFVYTTSLIVVLVLSAWGHGADFQRPTAHPESSDWENLFAEDLSDAIFPEGVWIFRHRILTAKKDQCI